ncbi:hypothetical protein PR048_017916 [Dryococelus australis]|uniref:PiggyBac transposable element-derived protein domain-containing protein n=1 Tax=Dryococelus australis TaxID=614101 RepID=A0ABQ9HAZ6_9NEOP|nr:hypothetical protein PR048_017916 [Dryococelus australis]
MMYENHDLILERGFTLHELLSILEDNDDSSDHEEIAVAIVPSTNTNSDLTDEDSGDEGNVTISNFSATQLQAKAQLFPGGGQLLWRCHLYSHDNEIKCFISILLLSGYVSVARRRMFWEGSKDCYNEIVSSL